MSGEEKKQPCPICFEESDAQRMASKDEVGPEWFFECPRCGDFIITFMAKEIAEDQDGDLERLFCLEKKGSRKRADLSAWLRERDEKVKQTNSRRESILLNQSFFDKGVENTDRIAFQMAAAQVRTFHDRADKLLMIIDKYTEYAGQPIFVDGQVDKYIALSWSNNIREFNELVRHLKNRKFVLLKKYNRKKDGTTVQTAFEIAPDGWAHLEKLKEINPESRNGFIAMQFKDKYKILDLGKLLDRGLKPAIERAGYIAVRVDKVQHANYIPDEIFSQIRKARFVVADLSYHNPNVYLEAGFAMGLGIPVFYTCNSREEHNKQAPFNLQQYNQISWTEGDWEQLIDALSFRISGVIGQGPEPIKKQTQQPS